MTIQVALAQVYVLMLLQREGKQLVRGYKSPGPGVALRYDRETATARAKQLRAQGRSLREVGPWLRKSAASSPAATGWQSHR